ncbi:MAG: molybdenum cofactor guanylyltransferase [Thermanaerothrix sp.]|nr:molybdenum cofactor guanylyltransferase [Thermanaerothrix sp.]
MTEEVLGPPIPGALCVLCGGLGSRMGGPKHLAVLGGRPMWERVVLRLRGLFQGVVIGASFGGGGFFPDRLEGTCLKVAEDSAPGLGPLEGLRAVMWASSFEWAFVVGCDMPLVSPSVVRRMWGFADARWDAVLLRLGGYVEPLHGFYRRSCLGPVEEVLRRGGRGMKDFHHAVRVVLLEVGEVGGEEAVRRSIMGANDPLELKAIEKFL